MNQLALDLQPAEPEYRIIPLTQGQHALVDTEDYERISRWKWCAHFDPKTQSFRAQRGYWRKGKCTSVWMHREVMRAPEGVSVDHRNHDTLDNRRANLRLATHVENCCNRRRRADNVSGFKGVHRNKDSPNWETKPRWRVRVMVDGKRKLIGDFTTLEAAAEAYAKAVVELHGEFAKL